MTTHLTKAAFVLAFTLGIATPALAEGFYAAFDIGQAKGADLCNVTGSVIANDIAASGITACKDSATAYRITGGYQFTPNWGVEASYADFGTADLGVTTTPAPGGWPAGTPLGSWNATGFELAGTGTLPLVNNFSVFAKLGVALTSLDMAWGSTAYSTSLAAGVGAQYDFLQNFGVRVQYDNFGTIGNSGSTGTTKLTLLSAGLIYRFY